MSFKTEARAAAVREGVVVAESALHNAALPTMADLNVALFRAAPVASSPEYAHGWNAALNHIYNTMCATVCEVRAIIAEGE